jgi:hypothetical protein
MAYPLATDDTIDVSESGLPPEPWRPNVVGPRLPYRSLQGDENAWVLLEGDVIARDAIAARLRAAGLTVLRVGRWLGDAVDGFAADWFVRFLPPVGADSVDAVLAEIIGSAPTRSPTPADMRIHVLEAALASAHARESMLRDALAAGRGSPAPRPPDADSMMPRQSGSISASEGVPVVESPELAPMVQAATAYKPAPIARRLHDEVAVVIETLLPHARLLRDSLTVISAEFRDRRALYRALAELRETGPRLPPAWKKVRGLDAWWERHVGNGEDDAGRIYGRRSSEEQIWRVLISHKGEQDRDLAWLRRQ